MNLILQSYALIENIITRMVGVTYHFTLVDTVGDPNYGQWVVTNFTTTFTDKGNAITNALATIIHMGLDFVAQLSTLLPAVSSTVYNSFDASSFEIIAP